MNFEVVIIGSDINAYYMARSTYEAYNKKAYLLAKEPMNFTKLSNILNIEYIGDLWNQEIFLKALLDFKERFKDRKLLLIGSNDFYVRLINENAEVLKQYYTFHQISLELLDSFLIKDKFYEKFNNKGIDIPKTYIYQANEDFDNNKIKGFIWPLILKPGNGVTYYHHHFENQAKVYKLQNLEELMSVIKTIEASGYNDKLIIQEFIPGDDTRLFDCIFYVDKNHRATLATFAQIALQEHTSTGVGNLTVLVNGYNEFGSSEEVIARLKKFIEQSGYTGFCEFDLKYDERDKTFKVFEINPRQARSSYYLTALNHNLIKYLVDDLILYKEDEFKVLTEEIVLSFVPKKVIEEHVHNDKLKNKIFNLIKEKKSCDPLDCKLEKHFLRSVWLQIRKRNYIKKYREYNW